MRIVELNLIAHNFGFLIIVFKRRPAIHNKISKIAQSAETGVAVNARTRELLTNAATELKSALAITDENYDIFSEHTRRAADAIGKILGTITAADVMDATFSQLCLGK